MKKLLHCPFCGGEGKLISYLHDGGYVAEIHCMSGPDIGFFAISKHWAAKEEWAKESVINAWNRRYLCNDGKKRKGTWIDFHYVSGSEVERTCSECMSVIKTNWTQEMNYCPSCGTKMDLVSS